MIVNQGSNIADVLQAIQGTWNNIVDNDWQVVEMGTIKFYRKMCKEGNNVLPSTFLKNRNNVVGYWAFTKNNVTGGVIGLQDQYITLESNALVIIINI
jgi:hypothetical protein